MKSKIIELGKNYHFIIKIARMCDFIIERCKYLIYYLTNKTDDKMVIFEVFGGRKYWDSPKAIYEFMIKSDDFKDYTFIWAFKDTTKYEFLKNNKNTILVKSGSMSYYKYFAKSKYWIVNYRISDVLKKKKSQIYVQCWHGTPLKKLGCDIKVDGNILNTVKEIHKNYKNDSKRYDYMLSPSKFCTDAFASAFDIKDKSIIIESGYPRNDAIINHKKSDIASIKRKLNIPPNVKVILYAPTFRDNEHDSKVGYTYRPNIDFDALKKEFDGEYIILYRAHYLVANAFDFDKYKGFVYDVCEYDDINVLYIISDLLITDYSSVFFDYSILKRPIIFYMYDLDLYKNKLRDFYLDLSELPGNIVKTDKELIQEIKKEKNFKYDERYKHFNEKFTYLEDGKTTQRVVSNIFGRKK